MARTPRIAAAALIAALALSAGTALPPLAAPAARAQDADTHLDRALQKVEAMIAALKAQAGSDPKLIQGLQEVADEIRKEKAAQTGPGGGPPGGPAPPSLEAMAWGWAKDVFFAGLDLKEDEKAAAEQVLQEFCLDYKLAKDNGDDKSKPVVRDHTEKRIARTFAARDANKMKDNLATLIRRWEWTGGRKGK